jgi:hypothetical protein
MDSLHANPARLDAPHSKRFPALRFFSDPRAAEQRQPGTRDARPQPVNSTSLMERLPAVPVDFDDLFARQPLEVQLSRNRASASRVAQTDNVSDATIRTDF